MARRNRVVVEKKEERPESGREKFWSDAYTCHAETLGSGNAHTSTSVCRKNVKTCGWSSGKPWKMKEVSSHRHSPEKPRTAAQAARLVE